MIETREIHQDTSAIKEDTALILEEIAKLQARLPADCLSPTDFVLQRYLEELSALTETDHDSMSVQWLEPWHPSSAVSIRSGSRSRSNRLKSTQTSSQEASQRATKTGPMPNGRALQLLIVLNPILRYLRQTSFISLLQRP